MGAKDERRRLERRLRAVERGTLKRGFAGSREAMAAMVVVRAIERAAELAGEQGAGTALQRALRDARSPIEAFLEGHLRVARARRRKP